MFLCTDVHLNRILMLNIMHAVFFESVEKPLYFHNIVILELFFIKTLSIKKYSQEYTKFLT